MEDRQRERELLEAIPEKAGDDARILMMRDGTSELGWVAVELLHSVLRMIHMEIPGCEKLDGLSGENVFIADTLMRSAASYGAAVGATGFVLCSRSSTGSWLQGGSLPGKTGPRRL